MFTRKCHPDSITLPLESHVDHIVSDRLQIYPLTPTPQNDLTDSNNSSARASNCLSVFDHFVRLALERLSEFINFY